MEEVRIRDSRRIRLGLISKDSIPETPTTKYMTASFSPIAKMWLLLASSMNINMAQLKC